MIQEIGLSDLGDTSGVDGPSSTDCHSSSRASHLFGTEALGRVREARREFARCPERGLAPTAFLH